MPHIDISSIIWASIGAVVALPAALYVAWMATARWKLLGLLSGFLGVVFGLVAAFFLWINVLATTPLLDGPTFMLTTLLLCSVTGLIGVLLFNFLFGTTNSQSRSTQVEF